MKRSDITTLDVLSVYKQRTEHDGCDPAEKMLSERFPDAPFKVLWAAMERECDNGFVEYGINLRWGWLTPKGKEKFRELTGEQVAA